MIKIASLSSWLLGIGFGLPCIYGIIHLWQGKGIAYVMGYPSYGNGPFEKIGVHTSVPLLISFLLVCISECITGQMQWNLNKGGAVLSFAIIPLEMTFYIGFALPFGPPLVAVRTLLVLLSWSSFSQV
jgi:hypothetical protein